MDLQTYIDDMDRRRALAKACGTDPGYLWQLATGWDDRRPSPEMAKRIEAESEKLGPERVPKELLRPDIWPPSDLPVAV